MKRIAFISEHASPLALPGGIDNGGQNVYVAELAKALSKKNYCIDIFTRKCNHQQPEIVDWLPNIRVIHVKAGPEEIIEKENLLQHMKEFADNMFYFMRRQQQMYDLIHAHFFMSALVASAIKKILRIPYIVTFHALGLVRKKFQKEADRFPAERCDIERFIVADADGLIAECPQDREDLINLYHADPGKISMAPCGFNPSEFHPMDKYDARRLLSMPVDEPILLQLGRMVPRKGVDTVIRALGRLKCNGQKPLLVIVGGNSEDADVNTTPEIGRLQKIAAEENVLAQIKFAGRKCREILRAYYSAADIFITTPWYEPFGITPLEAMACGVPVIGSDTGGIKYSVSHGETGLLVPPNDPISLASNISFLLNDKKLAMRMGKNGLRRVHKRFTWGKVAEQIAEIYAAIEVSLHKKYNSRSRTTETELFSFKRAATLLKQPFFPSLYPGYE